MNSRLRRAFALFLLLSAFSSFAGPPALADDLDLSAYKGKVVYLDFWASWCVPCRLSFPWMNELQQEYAGKGFTVVAVNMDHDGAAAQQFLSQMPASFKIVFDPRAMWRKNIR